MPLPSWLCCFQNKERLANIYLIGVIATRTWGDYFLSTIIEFLVENADFNPALASAIVNIKDGFAGVGGIIGVILVDVYLTNYGMIFFSALMFCIGMLLWRFTATDGDTIAIPFAGLFISGAANLCLMNSSNTLAKEKRDANEDDSNSLTKFIGFVFGNDTEVFRLAQAHGKVIMLVFIKYMTKLVFIAVTVFIGHAFGNEDAGSTDYGLYFALANFFIPTVGLLLVALSSLVYVKSFMKPVADRGTPLKHVVRVCMAAFRNRHLPCPQSISVGMLHEGSLEHPQEHTEGLRFLDKAAFIQSSQPEENGNRHQLCTVTEVEETKSLLRMVPMSLTFLLYGLVKSVGTTLFLIQGKYMDVTLGKSNLEVPLQTLIIFGEISGLATKSLYYLLISKRLSGQGKRYASPIKYGIGIILATFCCTVASWVAADKDNRESVFWLTPQFLLFGAMSEVTREGIEGFFQDQLPPSMRRYGSVFTDGMIGAGAVLCAALVYATHSRLDENKQLAIFYRLLTVACFFILSSYTFVASRYRYQDNKEAQSTQDI